MRWIWIANHGTVNVIDDSIVVEVPEAYIARLGTYLYGMAVYFLFILEYSVSNVTIEHIDRIIVGQHRYIRVVNLVDVVWHITVEAFYLVTVISIDDASLPLQRSLYVYCVE